MSRRLPHERVGVHGSMCFTMPLGWVGGVCLQRTLRQLVVGHTLRKDGDEWVVKHRQGVLAPQ